MTARAAQTGKSGDSLLNDVLANIAKPGCFAAGTLVHTKEGLVPIEKIQIGDSVLSRCERTGQQAYKRVVNVFQHEPQVVIEIFVTTANKPAATRMKLVTTREHLFWVKDEGWLKAGNLDNHWQSKQRFILADGSDAMSRGRENIYTTEDPGVGWIPTQMGDETREGFMWNYLDNKFVADKTKALQALREWREEYDHPMYQVPEEFRFKLPVYNLEVEDFHTYYVGKLGVWVHNECRQQTAQQSGSDTIFPRCLLKSSLAAFRAQESHVEREKNRV